MPIFLIVAIIFLKITGVFFKNLEEIDEHEADYLKGLRILRKKDHFLNQRYIERGKHCIQ